MIINIDAGKDLSIKRTPSGRAILDIKIGENNSLYIAELDFPLLVNLLQQAQADSKLIADRITHGRSFGNYRSDITK